MLYDQHLEPVYPETVTGTCKVLATSPVLRHLMDRTIHFEGYELPDGLVEAWSADDGAIDLTVYPGDVGRPGKPGQFGAVHSKHPDIAAARDIVQFFYRHRLIAR